jgi:hypothetical protein
MSDAPDPSFAVVEDAPAAATPAAPRRRRLVGDPLPAVCELKDVAELLGLGATRVWDLYQAHELDFALLQPAIGHKPRFSGKKLQAWCDGELDLEAAAAAPAVRQFFGGGRKRR